MSWFDNLKDPAIVGPAGLTAGFFGKQISEFLRRRFEIKKLEVETEPDRDRIWMDGMMKLVEQLDKRSQEQSRQISDQSTIIARQSTQIEALTEEVSDLNEHVDNLTSVLKANNITPPPRRRRSATASVEITA